MTVSNLDKVCFLVILASALLVLGLGWEWPVYAGLAATVPPCFTVFKRLGELLRAVAHG